MAVTLCWQVGKGKNRRYKKVNLGNQVKLTETGRWSRPVWNYVSLADAINLLLVFLEFRDVCLLACV